MHLKTSDVSIEYPLTETEFSIEQPEAKLK